MIKLSYIAVDFEQELGASKTSSMLFAIRTTAEEGLEIHILDVTFLFFMSGC